MTVSRPGPAELLEVFQQQVRARDRDVVPGDVVVERDGPVLRTAGLSDRGFVEYRDLEGIDGAELDELIQRQIRFFADRGERFEWKYYGHDLPADLPDAAPGAGFVPEGEETVLIARVADAERRAACRTGWSCVSGRAGLRPARMPGSGARGAAREVHIAEHARAAHGRRPRRAEGGRSRGRRGGRVRGLGAVTAHRLRHALGWRDPPGVARPGHLPRARGLPGDARRGAGLRYLQVDASDDSRPILERLGFVAVTTTTPYVWSPPLRGAEDAEPGDRADREREGSAQERKGEAASSDAASAARAQPRRCRCS